MKTNEVKFESLVELSLKRSVMGLTLADNETQTSNLKLIFIPVIKS